MSTTFVRLNIESEAPDGTRITSEAKITHELIGSSPSWILKSIYDDLKRKHDNAAWIHGTGRAYLTKRREQWTQFDVEQAIADGYYAKGCACGRLGCVIGPFVDA